MKSSSSSVEGTGSNRSTKSAGDRFAILTSTDLGHSIRVATHVTNTTISDVVCWCVAQSIDDYVRRHRVREITRLRPGKRVRLSR